MTDHCETRAKDVAEVLNLTLSSDEERRLTALLWDYNAEDWERGVTWSRMLGSFPPPRPPNPYRDSP